MDKQYFLRPGIQSQHHFDSSISPSPVSTWQSLPTPPDQSFLNHYNWDNTNNYNKSTQHFNYTHFVSPPPAPATTSTAPTDGFTIRELIGKLGTICTATEITPSLPPASPYSANNSCYSTPLNSPPKTNIQIENLHNFKNSMPLSPPLPAVAADPGFAERAAKFSSFGSRSFNGRTNQFRPNKNESQYRSITPFTGSGKLHRVSSNPSLNLAGSSMGVQEIKSPAHVKLNYLANDPKFNRLSASAANSNDDSSVSEQTPSGETGFRGQNNVDSRKRKPISRGNAKEDSANVIKKAGDEYLKAKRSKLTERNVKSEEEINNGTEEGQKQGKNNDSPKPPEPPKDYIHVRARRGQATDSHSLAERVRREKIGERMKLLQNLVPGCNKVTGKALMLDEIINYVQSLQCQVEFLSMKLASVNPRLDINMDSILSKDIFQQNSTMPHQNHPINSSIPALFGRQNQQIHNNLSSNGVVDPLALNLPQFDAFGDHLSQFSTFYGDDLQSIVQMGFGENHSSDLPFQLQSFDDAGQNQTSQMKIEL